MNNKLKNILIVFFPILVFFFFLASCSGSFLDPSLENEAVQVRSIGAGGPSTFTPFTPRVGVYPDSSVLSDPNNQMADVTGIHGARWDIYNNLTNGGTDLIHRFYVWATVNAKAPFGESQYYTAFALQEILNTNLVTPGHEDTVRNIIVRCLVAVIDEFPDGFLFVDFNRTPEGIFFPPNGVIDVVNYASAYAYDELANYTSVFDRGVFRVERGVIESGDAGETNFSAITRIVRVKSEFGWRN